MKQYINLMVCVFHVYLKLVSSKILIDHCVDDGHADYLFLHTNQEMHVKLKVTQFERNGDCESEEEVTKCHKQCFEKPENSGCIGGIISNEIFNVIDCSETVNLTISKDESLEYGFSF